MRQGGGPIYKKWTRNRRDILRVGGGPLKGVKAVNYASHTVRLKVNVGFWRCAVVAPGWRETHHKVTGLVHAWGGTDLRYILIHVDYILIWAVGSRVTRRVLTGDANRMGSQLQNTRSIGETRAK